MVTTFLTSKNFEKSAKNLDYRRYGKQRVEAYQIIILHWNLDLLGLYFNISKPKLSDEVQQFIEIQRWADTVIKTYKECDYRLAIKNNQLIQIDKSNDYISICSSNERFIKMIDQRVSYGGRIYDRNNVFIASDDERIITLGFINNPTSRMWLGYTNCLIEYMNAHILEWVSRGYQNTMRIIKVSDVKYPFWLNSELILSHKSVLYQKDPIHYSQFSHIPPTGYLWPTKLYS